MNKYNKKMKKSIYILKLLFLKINLLKCDNIII